MGNELFFINGDYLMHKDVVSRIKAEWAPYRVEGLGNRVVPTYSGKSPRRAAGTRIVLKPIQYFPYDELYNFFLKKFSVILSIFISINMDNIKPYLLLCPNLWKRDKNLNIQLISMFISISV